MTAFVGLLLGTVLTIGAVVYVETSRALEVLVQQNLDAVTHATRTEVDRLLSPAPRILTELEILIRRDVLPRDDPQRFGEVFVERMRQHPSLGWLGYADRASHAFTGATRSAPGPLRYYRAAVDVNDGVPTELVVDVDGRWTDASTSTDPYDATTRDWFVASLTDPQLRWLEPYQFTDGAWGISVTRGVVHDGEVVGVLLADFFLADLTRTLDTLRVGETGRVVLVTAEGMVLGQVDDELAAIAKGAAEGTVLVDVAGEPHRLVRQAVHMDGGPAWRLVILVPERELSGVATDNALQTLILGGVALGLAVIMAFAFANALSKPIRAMSADLGRISQLHLSDTPAPSSVIAEVATMAASIDAMKAGLRSFSRYVPVDLVRQLLADGHEARLGGETRELTIVFSDIAGFTTMVEASSHEVVVDALGEYLRRMNAAIGGSGGTVCQYLGDGIMALWGAPESQADHALRGCRGALAMRDVARDLVATAEHDGRPPLPTRIGVNSGQVLVGNIGAPERFNYAALGDPVNTAARIEGLNKMYGTAVLIGERTAELVGDAMITRPVDVVRMKGKELPIRVYELVGERGALPDEIVDACARHATAFDAYLAGRFDHAAAGFETLDDPVANALAARCREYERDGPPEDWASGRVMTQK